MRAQRRALYLAAQADAAPSEGTAYPRKKMVAVPRIERRTAYCGMLPCSISCSLMTSFHLHFKPTCAIAFF